jgi:nucleoside-diphosphate-sugar epimerase
VLSCRRGIPCELIHNQASNVGQTEENYRIRTLAEIVREVVAGSRLEYAKDARPDPRRYRVDFRKIHRLLPEFKAAVERARGAEELYTTYRTPGVVLEHCEGPRFKRIDHLKQLLAGSPAR